MKYFESISDAAREKLFAEMRRLHVRADRHAESYKALAPRNGAIAAGGAHFDEFLKSEAIYDFLRGLNRGKTPQEAAEHAKGEARQAIAKWNARREALVHRLGGLGRRDDRNLPPPDHRGAGQRSGSRDRSGLTGCAIRGALGRAPRPRIPFDPARGEAAAPRVNCMPPAKPNRSPKP